jgi:hypothetical protein
LAVDFFTAPTVTFDVLYVFVVLSLERRLILHANVTAHPYAAWAAQQVVEAYGEDGAFKFLIRDRDAIFGRTFDQRMNNLGIRQLRIAPRSPWQNAFAERLVGTFRRELTDHLIVLNERHLVRCVREYARFCNCDRPHMSLGGDARPDARSRRPTEGTSSRSLDLAASIIDTQGTLHDLFTRTASCGAPRSRELRAASSAATSAANDDASPRELGSNERLVEPRTRDGPDARDDETLRTLGRCGDSAAMSVVTCCAASSI